MKTAISIPDPIFKSAEALARRLKLSRSQLYATALAEFLAKNKRQRITERINAVYDEGGIEVDHVPLTLTVRSIPPETW